MVESRFVRIFVARNKDDMSRGHKSPLFYCKKVISKEQILNLANAHLAGGPIYVTGVRISSDNHINVYIDGDNGVTITDCVALSRVIEGALDRGKDDFALDVSSHGATTPLTMPRQYKKHIGRTLEVRLNNGEKAEGVIGAADDSGIMIRYQVRENKTIGKGKVTVDKELRIEYTEIKEAKIKLKY